ncbi:CocE/NonD family hydrolase [Shouchella hunanensis]|uniref:CocE/NonD family hydrolase n=1 Tax=Shouchella hunanensis TaxID=766894 RepID=A0ABY7W378_9BACI|nr:CocE/NonD family hydrolase [Shouchella hunanensis]WDF03334.1 CocE/NonD family hydrolase [Shouchella hunanensis]
MVFNVRDSKLHIKEDYHYDIEVMEHSWIPMSDGTKLAAKIWLPKGAQNQPVPAVLEYLPYRKNDFTALRDSIRHPYFAGHGYASIRVDIRGTGDSDGILHDEYLPQEQEDALEILAWLEDQPWCTGDVGMIGKSWGGFNGLQVAKHQPKQLKAVITLCSTDDRYADDVHYMGGNILASDMLWWSSTMFAYNARPQDPVVVGESWYKNWLERLEKTPPYVEKWLTHQHRDDYWKQGSVNEDYEAMTVPVFAVGGWADGYTNAIFRMLEHFSGPKKGLIGPWVHEYPEVAIPGPAVGFLQECVRWWDHWLKGVNTGIMDEPMLTAWQQESIKPAVHYEERPGKWIFEDSWKDAERQQQTFSLTSAGKLTLERAEDATISLASVQQHGLYSGVWCPFGQEGDMPSDQRMEKGLSTTFTTEPLDDALHLLGLPKVTIQFKSNKADALIAARLCDVAPDGAETMISFGMLNLNHLHGHAFPEALELGQEYTATIQLNAVGIRIPKGHRLQLALSPTYWPHAWPSKEEATIEIVTGTSTVLQLPVRDDGAHAQDGEWPFEKPEAAPVMGREILRKESRYRHINYDLLSERWVLDDFSDEGKRKLPANGLEYGSTNRNVYTIREGDPLSAEAHCKWELTLGRGDWQTEVHTDSKMTADKTNFYLENTLKAYLRDELVFEKTWEKMIPRDFQ